MMMMEREMAFQAGFEVDSYRTAAQASALHFFEWAQSELERRSCSLPRTADGTAYSTADVIALATLAAQLAATRGIEREIAANNN